MRSEQLRRLRQQGKSRLHRYPTFVRAHRLNVSGSVRRRDEASATMPSAHEGGIGAPIMS